MVGLHGGLTRHESSGRAAMCGGQGCLRDSQEHSLALPKLNRGLQTLICAHWHGPVLSDQRNTRTFAAMGAQQSLSILARYLECDPS